MSESDLTALLKELSTPNADLSAVVTPARVTELSAALSPGSDRDVSSLALLSLSKIVDLASSSGTADEQTARIKHVFDPLISDAVARNSEDPAALVPAVSLLAALAPLAPAAAVAILSQPLGVTKSAEESDVDPLTIVLEFAELPSPLQPAFAALLAALAGTKPGRALVRARALGWAEAASEPGAGAGDTAVLCAVALSKLGRGDAVPGEPAEEREAREAAAAEGEARYALQLAAHIKSSSVDSPALLSTLEGLSVLTTRPGVRDVLCADAGFLKALLALSPVPAPVGGSLPVTPRESMASLDESAERPVDGALCFGLATILVNLTARRPVLSQEDAQMARLRRMALSGKTQEEDDPAESEAAVRARVDKLVGAGVVPAMSGLVRAGSARVKTLLGALSCAIVEDRSHRAAFVREGGFKALSAAVRELTAGPPSSEALPALQALAKMAISVPPPLLFPPPAEVNALNALRPLELLLTHAAASLLQKFEALMALTNLASVSPAFGDRIVAAELPAPEGGMRGAGASDKVKVVDAVEGLMLDDNAMVQRAATELVCNLVACEKGFEYFSGERSEPPSKDGEKTPNPRAKARLGILLLLTDAEDMATRQAAAGALASLTDSPAACASLLAGGGIATASERSAWARVGDLFEPAGAQASSDGEKIETVSSAPPDAGLAHRGAVILANLVTYVQSLPEAEKGKEVKCIRDADAEGKLGRGAKALMGSQGAEGALQAILEALKGMKALESS